MQETLSEELVQHLEAAEAGDPHRAIPVVVTVRPGTDPTVLTHYGLSIRHVVESVSIISGTLTAAGVRALARRDEVESIGYDGPMRALDDPEAPGADD